MTTEMLDQDVQQQQDQVRSDQNLPSKRQLPIVRLLRYLAVASPIFLFLAATLTGIVYFGTLMPLLGTITIILVSAAGILTLLVTIFLVGS